MIVDICSDLEASIDKWNENFINDKIAHKASSNTIIIYKKILEEFREFCYIERVNGYKRNLSSIDRIFITNFINHIEKRSLSQNSLNLYKRVLKSFFKYISETNSDGLNLYSNISKIKESRVDKVKSSFSGEEQKRLTAYFLDELKKSSFLKVRNSLALLLLLYSGLRASELLDLKTADITVEDERVFKLLILGKGKKERVIYIRRDLFEEPFNKLNILKQKNKINSIYLICTKTSKPLPYDNLLRINKRVLEKLRINNKNGLHIYRHTFARELVNKNINLETIKEILGHSDISITSRYYAKTNEENKMGAVLV